MGEEVKTKMDFLKLVRKTFKNGDEFNETMRHVSRRPELMPPHLRKAYDQIGGPRPTLPRKTREHFFRTQFDMRKSYSDLSGREMRYTFRDSDYDSDGVRLMERRSNS